MSTTTVWTLVTDDEGISVSVHATEEDALGALFSAYDVPDGEIQTVIDTYAVSVYIESHEVTL